MLMKLTQGVAQSAQTFFNTAYKPKNIARPCFRVIQNDDHLIHSHSVKRNKLPVTTTEWPTDNTDIGGMSAHNNSTLFSSKFVNTCKGKYYYRYKENLDLANLDFATFKSSIKASFI